jgi:ubiquitin C-terminal hydrolase
MHNSISRGVKMKINGSKKNTTDDLAVICYQMLQSVYTKEYSEVMDLFYGIYVSILRPIGKLEGGSKKPEMFFILDLPIPSRINTDPITTLYQCFDLFTQIETLEGNNAWLNEETNQKESVTKQIQFWNLPKILVIVLKRFNHHGNNKRQDLVDFPLNNLNLSKYVCGYNPTSYVYDLYGVCNHMGGIMGGHYHCYVKNVEKDWIHYNDTNYSKLGSENDTDIVNKIVTPSAYCLFYRKR